MVNNDVAGSVAIEANNALFDGTRFTVTEYVLVVLPSCAVTTVVMVLLPRFKVIACEAAPDATDVPFTVTLAVGSLVVGVTVTDATVLATLAV